MAQRLPRRGRGCQGARVSGMSDWRKPDRIPDEIARILADARIAVLGMKTEAQPGQPAFYVPEYMAPGRLRDRARARLLPRCDRDPRQPSTPLSARSRSPWTWSMSSAGRTTSRRMCPTSSPPARVVWFQLGIGHDEAAETLARAGIEVVQDRCMVGTAGSADGDGGGETVDRESWSRPRGARRSRPPPMAPRRLRAASRPPRVPARRMSAIGRMCGRRRRSTSRSVSAIRMPTRITCRIRRSRGPSSRQWLFRTSCLWV